MSIPRVFLRLVCILAVPFICSWEPIPLDAPGHEWIDRALDEEFIRYEKTGITREMVDATSRICGPDGCLLHFKIINSTVHGPNCSLRSLLERMVKAYPVPDVEFFYYNQDVLRDWTFDYYGQNCAPVFASAKNRYLDQVILFVDWYYNINDGGGWNGLISLFNGNQDRFPWPSKIEKLFWRGVGSDGCYTMQNWTQIPRGRLVYYSKYFYPDLIDAGFTGVPPLHSNNRDVFNREIGFVGWTSPLDHVRFKYQFLADGITSTYPGSQWRLLSGCLTMKHESDDLMWFYRDLVPWKHYVPLKRDLSDVAEKILWAKSHDDEAYQIAMNAREFALTHLMPEHILLYCYKALVRYASLQRFQPN
jgi:hypothetical protein